MESNEYRDARPNAGGRTAITHDLHPSKELNEATNWNMHCIFYAIVLEALTLIVYTEWSVFGIVLAAGFLPLILNLVWLLLPFRLKRKAVISNKGAFAFYTIQTIFFCFDIGVMTYFLASTISYEWKDNYLWSNMWLMSSTLLFLTGFLAALH